MLTHAWMGAVALFVLWGNTLLVGLAAVRNLASLRALVRGANPLDVASLSPGTHVGWFRARAAEPCGVHVIHQLGRLGAGLSIIWHDKRTESRSCDSKLTVGELELLVPARSEHVAVWPEADAIRAAAVCPSGSEFDLAAAGARKPKGFERPVEIPLSGDVFVLGTVRVGDKIELAPSADRPLVFSAFDPQEFVAQRTKVVVFLFLPAITLLAAGCTWLAMSPPVFESWLSKLGGLLGFIFFLLVLPAGTRLRDFLLPPHRQFLRGAWTDPRKT